MYILTKKCRGELEIVCTWLISANGKYKTFILLFFGTEPTKRKK